MKIEIFGEPTFWLHIDKETVASLMKWSASHYDDVCRNAGEYGGFIYGWNNQVEDSGPGKIVVKATWRQLDIALKICEMEPEKSKEFARAGFAAFKAASNAAKDWKLEIEQ